MNSRRYRTANQRAPAGSEEDIFKFNPWRAPGRAPVADACGMAGGSPVTESARACSYFYARRYRKPLNLGCQRFRW